MNLSDELIVELSKEIELKIGDIYVKYVNEVSLSQFIDEVIKSIKNKINHFSCVNDEILSILENRMNKTKSRWYKKELAERIGLSKEIEIAKKIYNKFNNEEKFEIIYDGVKNLKELEKVRIEEIEEWYKNKNKLLSDFIYLETKMAYQIKLALINDAKYIGLKAIKTKSNISKSSLIINMPHSMSNIPIDYTNRAAINIKNLDTVITEDNKKYFIDKYYIDDNKIFESLVDIQILHNDVIRNFIGTLNLLDSTILSYLLSVGQSDEMFYSTREVVVGIASILAYCGLTDGVKNYKAVQESLFKMQYLTSGVFDSSLKGFTVKILDNVFIYGADSKSMAKVIFNIDIINQLVKAKTIKMYKNVIDNFELPASKVLIFRLQRERVSISLEKKKPLILKVNMNFFRGTLYFSDKKRYRNVKVVEESLNEIIENQIALKSYKRNGEDFILEFFPITENERLDLIKQLE